MAQREAVTRRMILMRHGQAHPEEPPHEDFARALTERGRRDAEAMGRLLMRRGWIPDTIVASPAERTAATARIVAETLDFDGASLAWAPELYLADADQYWQALESQDATRCCVLIVGHNPGLSRLAGLLGKPAQRRELPTAGLVTAVFEGASWRGLEPSTALDCEAASPDDPGVA